MRIDPNRLERLQTFGKRFAGLQVPDEGESPGKIALRLPVFRVELTREASTPDGTLAALAATPGSGGGGSGGRPAPSLPPPTPGLLACAEGVTVVLLSSYADRLPGFVGVRPPRRPVPRHNARGLQDVIV